MTAETTVRRKTSVDVRVPLGAAPGPVAVVDSQRRALGALVGPVALDPAAPAVAPSVEIAIRAPRAYYDAATPAAATYVVHGGGSRDRRRRRGARARRRRDHALGRARRGARGRAAARVGRHRRRRGPGRREVRVPGHGRRPRSGERAVRVLQRPLSRSSARRGSGPAPPRSAAGAGIRARTRSPPAGRRSSLRTAARSSSRAITRRPATTS